MALSENTLNHSFYGKIIGALIGLSLIKLPGLLVGLFVGHLFDVFYAKEFSRQGGFAGFFSSKSNIQNQAIFFHALFSALGHVCKADGKVTPEEIAVASALMDNMNLTGNTRKEAQQAFREGKARDFPLARMLDNFKQHCHSRRDVLQVYLEILISAACADGAVSSAEVRVLEKVAKSLGFSRKDLHFLITTYQAQQRFRQRGSGQQHFNQREYRSQQQYQQYTSSNSLSDAYKIIGAKESDDDKSIKRAYKRQMAQHHPDKLSAKDLPKQAIELAKSKTQDIQAAYELIKQRRGMK